MTAYQSYLKRQAKVVWAEFCTHSRLSDVVLRVRQWLNGSAPVAILTYHRILPVEKIGEVYSSPHIITSAKDFKKQIRFLANNYRVLTLESFADLRSNRASLPNKCVILTFDDGWQDNYHYAFPILRKYHVPATIFLTTEFVGHRLVFWQERLRFLLQTLSGQTLPKGSSFPESLRPWDETLTRVVDSDNSRAGIKAMVRSVKEQGETIGESLVNALDAFLGSPEFPIQLHSFLTWDQVRMMVTGGISFGSHTCRHRLLTGIPDGEVNEEITGSKRLLEAELGHEITTFAYPSGMYRSQIFGQLKAAGYRLAVTTEPGLNSLRTHPYRLRRINMETRRFQGPNGRFSESLFAARLAGML